MEVYLQSQVLQICCEILLGRSQDKMDPDLNFWWGRIALLSRRIVYLPESPRGVTFFMSGISFFHAFHRAKMAFPRPTKVSEMVAGESSQLICDTFPPASERGDVFQDTSGVW